jgi:putative hydrolase of HD superfamily
MRAEALLPFLKEVDRLKAVQRQTLVHSGERKENSAEHSWHLALAVLIFHNLAAEEIDLGRALTMALLHDLVEIDAGDTFVYANRADRKEKERAALDRVTGLLPESLGSEFKNAWLELEANESAEAKFVSALDRFLPLYSNYLNGGHSWKNHQITSDQVVAKNKDPISEGVPELWEIAGRMIEEARVRGDLGS